VSVSVASSIQYQGDLTFGEQVSSSFNDSHWWSFTANKGDSVTITALRGEVNLDPALVLYRGLAESTSMLTYLAFADDEIDTAGIFGDPQLKDFQIMSTGDYSIRLFSFWSDNSGQDSLHPYSISVVGSTVMTEKKSNVSEPATLGILALAMLSLMGLRRKK